MDGFSPSYAQWGGSSLSPSAGEFCLMGSAPTVADPTGGSSRPLSLGAPEFRPATHPPGKLSVTIEYLSPDDFGRVVGKGFSHAIAICDKVRNGAEVRKMGTHTLLLQANTSEALKMLHEAMVLHIETVCFKALKPRIFREKVECGQVSIISLTVGPKFVETIAMCDTVGNGARILRVPSDDVKSTSLVLQANTQEALDQLKGLVLARITSVMDSQNVNWAIINFEQAAIFSLTVGSKFVETNAMCEAVGNGARIERLAPDGTELMLKANTQVALDQLTGLVLARIARVKASQDVGSRVKKVSTWSPPFDEPPRPISSGGSGVRHVIIFNTNVFVNARFFRGKSDGTLRVSLDGLVKVLENSTAGNRTVIGQRLIIGAEPDSVVSSYKAMGYDQGNVDDLMGIVCKHVGSVSETLVIAACDGSEDLVYLAAMSGMRVELWSWMNARSPNFDAIARHFTDGRIQLRDLDEHTGRLLFNAALLPDKRTIAAARSAIMAAQQQSVTRCDCGIINCVSETCMCLCHGGGGGAAAARTYLKVSETDLRVLPSVREASPMSAGGGTSSPVTQQFMCSCDETECYGTVENCECSCHATQDTLLKELREEVRVNGPMTITALCNRFPRKPNTQYAVSRGITDVYQYDDILAEARNAGLYVQIGATMGKTLVHFKKPSTPSRFLPGLLEDAEKAGLPVLTWLRLPENAALRELQLKHERFLCELANEVFVRGSIAASELRSRFPNLAGFGNIFMSVRDAGLHIVTNEKNIVLRVVYCSCEEKGGCERTRTGSPYCDGP